MAETLLLPKISQSLADTKATFPSNNEDRERLTDYAHYKMLFEGKHFEAFSMQITSDRYGKDYAKLKYVVTNFASLISKIAADMLFSEPPTIKCERNQEFIEAFMHENKLHVQNYESALQNSYYGDALYKLRIGKRRPTDKEDTIIVEDNTPRVYFPVLQKDNVRAEPLEHVLAWKVKIPSDTSHDYLRKEVHKDNKIFQELWLLKGDKLDAQVDIALYDATLEPEQATRIDRPLIQHIPNWKTGERWNGYSDYADLGTIFYALNNRFTKVDNILDTHSDPILALPDGILDEQGKVRRDKLRMVEIPNTVAGEKPILPQYIIWDAKLEAAFDEIDKLIEVMMMISETSPDILGMGKGQSDSGRALKLKVMRTIGKVKRKRIYYDLALKEMLYTAQVLAKEWNISIQGKSVIGEPEMPTIKWEDGMPQDMRELIEEEQLRKDAGLTTTKDSLIRLDGMDDAEAEAKAKEIEKENQIEMPTSGLGNNNFNKTGDRNSDNPKVSGGK
jgi:hypothetical protein